MARWCGCCSAAIHYNLVGVVECRMARKVSPGGLLDEVVYCCHSRDQHWRVALSSTSDCSLVVVYLQVAVLSSGPPWDRMADCEGGHSTATLVDLFYPIHTSGILYHYLSISLYQGGTLDCL